ncbi:hypothetical protein FB446DRAFT_736661 [Lentinula raphanica]|nr:hypothetical protein FB446DRAFT_736661 [Lentinula raphanica]
MLLVFCAFLDGVLRWNTALCGFKGKIWNEYLSSNCYSSYRVSPINPLCHSKFGTFSSLFVGQFSVVLYSSSLH